MPGPIPYVWFDGAFSPKNLYWLGRANERFTDSQTYMLDEWQERSRASHNQYFAAIHDAWQNLPENEADQFATPDHLRKRALIQAGYRDESTYVAASKADAVRLAAFIKPMDEYSLVVIRGSTVIQYTAKSQTMRAMDKAEFQASKEAVLGVLAGMLDVSTGDLSDNAGQAA